MSADASVFMQQTYFRLLHDWLDAHGATNPATEIREGQSGREMCATSSIQRGALVLHIPRSLLITAEVAKNSAVGQCLVRNNCEVSAYAYLAVLLLDARSKGGDWKPYIETLPDCFPESPYFFSQQELSALSGSYVLALVEKRRVLLDKEFARLQAALSPGLDFTRDEFARALWSVRSRTYALRFGGQKQFSTLVPWADMPNHSFRPNLLFSTEASLGFIMTAARDISEGEALTVNYDNQCNGLLFANYGFCLEDNPHNVAELRFPELSPNHPNLDILQGCGLVRDGMRMFRVPANKKASSYRKLLSYLRLGAVRGGRQVQFDGCRSGFPEVGQISEANERIVEQQLEEACLARLRQFNNSIDEDLAMMRDESLPPNLRNVAQVRHGERNVLSFLLNLARSSALS